MLNTNRRTLCFAITLLSVIALVSCSGSNNQNGLVTVLSQQNVKPEFTIDPKDVDHLVDQDMALFKQYVYSRAKASGSAFPQYARWLDAVTTALVSDAPLPSSYERTAAAGDDELAPYRAPPPETHDLELLAAIAQKTHLESLGKQVIVPGLLGQPSATRQKAAAALKSRYSLK